MALIKSISGFRGTIGGTSGTNLTPIDIVECTAGYGKWLLNQSTEKSLVMIGRDARISGTVVNHLVVNTLLMMGIDVIDLGLSTTPTVEMAVMEEKASGGVILTASHNPEQWNALKLLNNKGEFISHEDAKEVLEFVRTKDFEFADVHSIGKYKTTDEYIQKHINSILAVEGLPIDKIKEKKFKVVVDCINSTGSISVVPILEQLGCQVIAINDDLSGRFAHNPEPLPKHLDQLSKAVIEEKADLGISVDPDVDRLAFVCEDGSMFGEEYTLVAVADYLLSIEKGNTVSNLSSSRALRDISDKHGVSYAASAVGEVNVVNKMKSTNAIIGGEGNGGIIYPGLHYGRDALVGIAFFLAQLSEEGITVSKLRAKYPSYKMIKDKIQLTPEIDIDLLLDYLKRKNQHEKINIEDGLKIDYLHGWVHLRKSNTEPIIRVYAEGNSVTEANEMADRIKEDVKTFFMEIN